MVKLTVNGKSIEVKEGTTILDAAKQNGIMVPSLCYFRNLNNIGACRVCVVEIVGRDKLAAACNTPVEEGMVVLTNSPKARASRKTNVELILSEHDCICPTCIRSGNCELQKISNDLNIHSENFETNIPENVWEWDAPLLRYDSKCIKCMRCVQVCDKVQSLKIWDVLGTGGRTTVGVSENRTIMTSACSFCGQCITHCPTGALQARDDTQKVLDAIADPDMTTVVQIAPAVRVAWGEYFGIKRENATVKRIAAALRQMGVDYVFDTNFSADLTIMEEGSEFLERFTHHDQYQWPMFTSCCPGWVRFLKSQFPEFTDNLSTAKSPQQMFGAVAKTFFAEKIGVAPEKICNISIMPCSSKKSECDLQTMNDAGTGKDVDVVITTRELVRLIRSFEIDPNLLEEEELDSPLGTGTGAAVIFGATGGVMDAALRSAYFLVTGCNPDADTFVNVRGMNGWKEATFTIPGAGDVRVAVVSGLGNARRIMEAIQSGEVEYDFVEVMACPGGCAGGGGQPIAMGKEMAEVRGNELWRLDANQKIRFSHENPDVQTVYKEYFGAPLSEKAHYLLHTDHSAWSMPE